MSTDSVSYTHLGFEPPAFRIGICCDIQLRYGRMCGYYSTEESRKQERRTHGAKIFFRRSTKLEKALIYVVFIMTVLLLYRIEQVARYIDLGAAEDADVDDEAGAVVGTLKDIWLRPRIRLFKVFRYGTA